VRAAALTAATAVQAGGVSAIVDAVLGVCDEEAVRQMAGHLLEESRLRALGIRDGTVQLEAEPARAIVAGWVGAARALVGEANYVEMDVDPDAGPGAEMQVGFAGSRERYAFRIQRRGRLTPHEARLAAEERLAQLLELHPEDRHLGQPSEPPAAGPRRESVPAAQPPGREM
jgi:hypothetical protein